MPEFRKDPTVDRWVIIAPERAKRPVRPEVSDTILCPFCAGNEHMTPPEVLVLRDKSDPSSLTKLDCASGSQQVSSPGIGWKRNSDD